MTNICRHCWKEHIKVSKLINWPSLGLSFKIVKLELRKVGKFYIHFTNLPLPLPTNVCKIPKISLFCKIWLSNLAILLTFRDPFLQCPLIFATRSKSKVEKNRAKVYFRSHRLGYIYLTLRYWIHHTVAIRSGLSATNNRFDCTEIDGWKQRNNLISIRPCAKSWGKNRRVCRFENDN